MSLDESRVEDVPQLTAVENDILAVPFSEKEGLSFQNSAEKAEAAQRRDH